jgi:hypothetical protein
MERARKKGGDTPKTSSATPNASTTTTIDMFAPLPVLGSPPGVRAKTKRSLNIHRAAPRVEASKLLVPLSKLGLDKSSEQEVKEPPFAMSFTLEKLSEHLKGPYTGLPPNIFLSSWPACFDYAQPNVEGGGVED